MSTNNMSSDSLASGVSPHNPLGSTMAGGGEGSSGLLAQASNLVLTTAQSPAGTPRMSNTLVPTTASPEGTSPHPVAAGEGSNPVNPQGSMMLVVESHSTEVLFQNRLMQLYNERLRSTVQAVILSIHEEIPTDHILLQLLADKDTAMFVRSRVAEVIDGTLTSLSHQQCQTLMGDVAHRDVEISRLQAALTQMQMQIQHLAVASGSSSNSLRGASAGTTSRSNSPNRSDVGAATNELSKRFSVLQQQNIDMKERSAQLEMELQRTQRHFNTQADVMLRLEQDVQHLSELNERLVSEVAASKAQKEVLIQKLDVATAAADVASTSSVVPHPPVGRHGVSPQRGASLSAQQVDSIAEVVRQGMSEFTEQVDATDRAKQDGIAVEVATRVQATVEEALQGLPHDVGAALHGDLKAMHQETVNVIVQAITHQEKDSQAKVEAERTAVVQGVVDAVVESMQQLQLQERRQREEEISEPAPPHVATRSDLDEVARTIISQTDTDLVQPLHDRMGALMETVTREFKEYRDHAVVETIANQRQEEENASKKTNDDQQLVQRVLEQMDAQKEVQRRHQEDQTQQLESTLKSLLQETVAQNLQAALSELSDAATSTQREDAVRQLDTVMSEQKVAIKAELEAVLRAHQDLVTAHQETLPVAPEVPPLTEEGIQKIVSSQIELLGAQFAASQTKEADDRPEVATAEAVQGMVSTLRSELVEQLQLLQAELSAPKGVVDREVQDSPTPGLDREAFVSAVVDAVNHQLHVKAQSEEAMHAKTRDDWTSATEGQTAHLETVLVALQDRLSTSVSSATAESLEAITLTASKLKAEVADGQRAQRQEEVETLQDSIVTALSRVWSQHNEETTAKQAEALQSAVEAQMDQVQKTVIAELVQLVTSQQEQQVLALEKESAAAAAFQGEATSTVTLLSKVQEATRAIGDDLATKLGGRLESQVGSMSSALQAESVSREQELVRVFQEQQRQFQDVATSAVDAATDQMKQVVQQQIDSYLVKGLSSAQEQTTLLTEALAAWKSESVKHVAASVSTEHAAHQEALDRRLSVFQKAMLEEVSATSRFTEARNGGLTEILAAVEAHQQDTLEQQKILFDEHAGKRLVDELAECKEEHRVAMEELREELKETQASAEQRLAVLREDQTQALVQVEALQMVQRNQVQQYDLLRQESIDLQAELHLLIGQIFQSCSEEPESLDKTTPPRPPLQDDAEEQHQAMDVELARSLLHKRQRALLCLVDANSTQEKAVQDHLETIASLEEKLKAQAEGHDEEMNKRLTGAQEERLASEKRILDDTHRIVARLVDVQIESLRQTSSATIPEEPLLEMKSLVADLSTTIPTMEERLGRYEKVVGQVLSLALKASQQEEASGTAKLADLIAIQQSQFQVLFDSLAETAKRTREAADVEIAQNSKNSAVAQEQLVAQVETLKREKHHQATELSIERTRVDGLLESKQEQLAVAQEKVTHLNRRLLEQEGINAELHDRCSTKENEVNRLSKLVAVQQALAGATPMSSVGGTPRRSGSAAVGLNVSVDRQSNAGNASVLSSVAGSPAPSRPGTASTPRPFGTTLGWNAGSKVGGTVQRPATPNSQQAGLGLPPSGPSSSGLFGGGAPGS